MISPEDLARVIDACRALPAAKGVYLEDDFVTNLLATVLDFQMNTTVVVRAIQHFKADHYDDVRTMADMRRLLARHRDDQEGNTALAQYLWGNNHWKRAHFLRDLVSYFERMGVRDQDALRTWATRSEYRRDFEGKVKGLGFAVYNWLVMRQGVDTVKPDVHVRRFVEAAVGRAVGDKDVVALVEGAAKALGKRAYELDWAIWEAQRNAPIETKPRSAAQPMTAAHQPATSSSGDLKLFRDDDAGYLAWIARHPAGFVINTAAKPAQSYVVLHRASCRFISGSPTNGRRWTRDPIKVCAPSARQLDDWSLVTVGDHPTGCGMCSP